MSNSTLSVSFSPSKYFSTIDVLRGFAALSVVVYHVIEIMEWKSFPITGPMLWFRIGWMGVDLFFVISGFVIGLSAFAGIDRNGPKAFRVPFFKHRFFRIAPLHYLTILVFVIFISPEILFSNFWGKLIPHLLFVQNLSTHLHGAINGSNWSLGTEMQFYVLMLMIAPWLRTAKYWKIFLTLVGIAWLWRWGVTSMFLSAPKLDVFRIFVTSTQLPGMLDEFAIGILLARFVRSEKGVQFLTQKDTRIPFLALIFVASLVLYATLTIYWHHATYWDNAFMVIMFRTLLAIAFGLVIFSACLVPQYKWLDFFLTPFKYLGTISFGIYLWHLPVLMSLKRLPWLEPSRVLPLTLCFTVIFAALSWHFFEQPLMQPQKKKML